MYLERLVSTPTPTDNAWELQQQLLAYHHFRNLKRRHPLAHELDAVAAWQAQRLKRTHADLYQHPHYCEGLNFLISDLYAPAGMTQRDDNIDRVFPKMVKWLPDSALGTLAHLVELNLLTQQLDLQLTERLQSLGYNCHALSTQQYCAGFNAVDEKPQRQRQITLVAESGHQLDRYVRNRTLGWMLTITRKPAEMAELNELHAFLQRGYQAFRRMANVEMLIDRLMTREQQVLNQIIAGHPDPFQVPHEN